MKTKSVSEFTCFNSRRVTSFVPRSILALAALLVLVALPSFSALATQCEPVDFEESGGPYPQTIYVFATTATSGATILATIGHHYIPANPTHGANCSPTGTTFICGGTFLVPAGYYLRIKAVACRAGMTDSIITYYEVDNTGP